jgi:hypothetical protein
MAHGLSSLLNSQAKRRRNSERNEHKEKLEVGPAGNRPRSKDEGHNDWQLRGSFASFVELLLTASLNIDNAREGVMLGSRKY